MAGHGPSADLTPCQFRRVVLAAAAADDGRLVARIHGLSVGGTLEPVGPGIHRATGPVVVRHVTSLLGPRLVSTVLHDIDDDGTGGVDVTLCPDADLGVTCVRLASQEPDPGRLEVFTATVAGALLFEEASRSLTGTTATWHGR